MTAKLAELSCCICNRPATTYQPSSRPEQPIPPTAPVRKAYARRRFLGPATPLSIITRRNGSQRGGEKNGESRSY